MHRRGSADGWDFPGRAPVTAGGARARLVSATGPGKTITTDTDPYGLIGRQKGEHGCDDQRHDSEVHHQGRGQEAPVP